LGEVHLGSGTAKDWFKGYGGLVGV
jgi:hypothetical protein